MIDENDLLTPGMLAKIFLKRAKSDKDSVVGITGYEGEGKSTLAAWIVIEMLRLLKKSEEEILENFNDYMIYSPKREDMENAVKNLPRYSPINADEAIKALYKLKWGSNSQIYLNTLYGLARQENKTSLLCMPRFKDFNEFFRNHRIRYWVHVLETGYFVLFFKDWSPFSSDPWWMDENQKIVNQGYKKKKVTDFSFEDKSRLLSRTRIYVGMGTFTDLPDDFKKIYREGKKKQAYADIDNKEQDGNLMVERSTKRLAETIKMLKEMGVSVKKICSRTGISSSNVYRYLNGQYSLAKSQTDAGNIITEEKGDNP